MPSRGPNNYSGMTGDFTSQTSASPNIKPPQTPSFSAYFQSHHYSQERFPPAKTYGSTTAIDKTTNGSIPLVERHSTSTSPYLVESQTGVVGSSRQANITPTQSQPLSQSASSSYSVLGADRRRTSLLAPEKSGKLNNRPSSPLPPTSPQASVPPYLPSFQHQQTQQLEIQQRQYGSIGENFNRATSPLVNNTLDNGKTYTYSMSSMNGASGATSALTGGSKLANNPLPLDSAKYRKGSSSSRSLHGLGGTSHLSAVGTGSPQNKSGLSVADALVDGLARSRNISVINNEDGLALRPAIDAMKSSDDGGTGTFSPPVFSDDELRDSVMPLMELPTNFAATKKLDLRQTPEEVAAMVALQTKVNLY
jgi:hypothetical protein